MTHVIRKWNLNSSCQVNVQPLVLCCARFGFCGLCSHVLCCRFNIQNLCEVCAVTPATVPGMRAETPTLSCLVLHTAGRRSAFNRANSNTAVGTLLHYFRQHDLIDLRIALRVLRWLASAILEAIREREQRTELDLIEGNV